MRFQGEAIQAGSIFQAPSFVSRVAWTIALYIGLGSIITAPLTCHAQPPSKPTTAMPEKVTKADVRAAQNTSANATSASDRNDPIENKTASSHTTAPDSWGQFEQKRCLLLIRPPSSCLTSTTDPCSGCQEPTWGISVIALN